LGQNPVILEYESCYPQDREALPMKAAVFEEFGQPITVKNVPDPTPNDDGVVIRVEANGICRSDWYGWQGHDPDVTLPHVPGHELAGVVVETGKSVKGWEAGERVTVPFSGGCGDCPQCKAGNQQICDQYFQPGFTAWGSFAQFVSIRYADVNLVRLPDEMEWITAASLGCRFVTAFRAVVDQGEVTSGDWVAVHGCGGVGLSAIMIASALGANVVGIDIGAEKLAFAQSVGASHTLDASKKDDLPGAIRDITKGGASVSIDALGSPQTCRNSILCLRKRGRHIQVGVMVGGDSDPALPMGPILGRELEIIGSHGMQAHRYSDLLKMIEAGKLNPRQLVRKTVTLEQSPGELEAMGDFQGTGMTVIDRF
jgi:alcohol dehydrogenase